MNAQLLAQARRLSIKERIELVETIWDDIAADDAIPPPTQAQRAELDRRLVDHADRPDDIAPWSDVKATTLARIGR